MTKRYMMTTICVGLSASVFIANWATRGVGGFFEDMVIQSGIGCALILFIYYRKAIKRIQELEREKEVGSPEE